MYDIPSLKNSKASLERQLSEAQGVYNEAAKRQDELAAKGIASLKGEELEQFRTNNTELTAKQDAKSLIATQLARVEADLAEAEKSMQPVNGLKVNNGNQPRFVSRITLGQALTESEAYKSLGGNMGKIPSGGMSIDVKDFNFIGAKALTISRMREDYMGAMKASDISTSQAQVFPMQIPEITPYPLWPPTFSDFLPKFEASSGVIKYLRETARTSGAGSRAETTALQQSDFTIVPISDTARVVGHYYKVTEEELADAPYMRQFLDFKGLLELNIAVENQLLTGDATGTNIEGFYTFNTANSNTYDLSTDTDSRGQTQSNVDAIARGLRKCRINGVCDPSVVVIHTDQMTAIRLLKNDLGDYIWGNPAEPLNIRMWGVPVHETPRAVSGSALTGDFIRFSGMATFRDLPLTMRFERVGTDALNLEWTLLAYLRLAVQKRRVAAFINITGLTNS